jgi:hypothetical protein
MLELLETLPRLPAEMEFMELHKGRLAKEPRKFNVRTKMVKKALYWLKEHQPAYRNITICEERLRLLEEGLTEDGQIVLPRLECPAGINIDAQMGNMGEQSAPTTTGNHKLFQNLTKVGLILVQMCCTTFVLVLSFVGFIFFVPLNIV